MIESPRRVASALLAVAVLAGCGTARVPVGPDQAPASPLAERRAMPASAEASALGYRATLMPEDRILVDTDGDGRIDLQLSWSGSIDSIGIKVDRDHDGSFDRAWSLETAVGGDAPDVRPIQEPVPAP